MTPGLINSVIHCAVLPPAGAVIQEALFQDDRERRIADLESRLRDSEAAGMGLIDALAKAEAEIQRLLHENAIKDQRLDIYRKLVVRGQPGRVVR